MKRYKTIFNNVLAPITPGPSSSNTCGPVRIGLVCQQLLGEIPADVVVEYASNGAFPTTLYGMKSDIAFINGLFGREQNNVFFKDAYLEAQKMGMKVCFSEVNDLEVGGLETVRIRMKTQAGEKLTVVGESLGGGAFVIHYIDDCPVDIQGTDYELLIFLKKESDKRIEIVKREILSQIGRINLCSYFIGKQYSLLNIKAPLRFPEELLDEIILREDVEKIRTILPIHPIVMDAFRKPPFETPTEMVDYCKKNICSPAQAAIEYEMAVSGWPKDKVREYGEKLIGIMRKSTDEGYQNKLSYDCVLSPAATTLKKKMNQEIISLGILDDAILNSLAIMEYSNASGKIVCVPTGGASGIVPGLLFSAAESINASNEKIYEALMCAGIIGIMMMVGGNEFSGGTHGCQVEIGCGIAMASAGLVQLMGGTAEDVCKAASMSIQCILGLICDPVGGFVQIPCIARNMAGVSIAAACAKAVYAGFDPVIPLEEMSYAMVRTGAAITNILGVGSSGCCGTPTGRQLDEKAHKKYKKNQQD